MDNPGSIKAIDKGAVHRLCSGQVILSLATAVKELVENSIDAGSTKVDVKLVDHGAASIEVVDDGCGVEPDNFEALALKHHTSKLADFEDLTFVQTFGFRGEALSSLCAIGNLTITTRHASQELGTTLVYDHDGIISSSEPVARPLGTTVKISNIFSTMPVRLKEFQRNVKREFAKLVKVLQGYCLISKKCRITCSNTNSKGKKTLVLSSGGQGDIERHVIDIFGSSQVTTLREIQTAIPSAEDLEHINLSPESPLLDMYEISGLVSTCEHGKGRSSPDRQFYFVNGRPCDLQKVAKAVHDVYHSFNRHQYPFVIMNIETKSVESVDVNVTPDKRQIFLEHEKVLLAIVRSSISRMCDNVPKTLTMNNMENAFVGVREEKGPTGDENISSFTLIKRRLESSLERSPPLKKRKSIIDPFKIEKHAHPAPNQPILEFFKGKRTPASEHIIDHKGSTPELGNNDKKDDFEALDSHEVEVLAKLDPVENGDSVEYVVEDANEGVDKSNRKEIRVNISLDRLKSHLGRKADSRSSGGFHRKFMANILPGDNETAEQELSRELSKEDFNRMKIFGQFNLGFIIAGLPPENCDETEDLFIIDQHATDEKYNFETLQKTQKLQSQNLAVHQNLDLSTVHRSILLSNLEVFTSNGFDFEIKEDDIRLKTIPFSKNWTFGKSDIEELLFMLTEAGSTEEISRLRPSRIRSMFASRACRTSVMIGTALNTKAMTKLVRHMAELEQPWNCPHGRPTLRHLINLNMLRSFLPGSK